MPPEGSNGTAGKARGLTGRHYGLLFPLMIVASVVVIVTPISPAVMDLLLAGNITLAVVVLLTAIHVRKPLEFSVFPAILLTATLSRLVLNIASTRLILSQGHLGTRAAGGVIEGFSRFVSGDSLAVGLVLFQV